MMRWTFAVCVTIIHTGAAITYALDENWSAVIWVAAASVWFINWSIGQSTAAKWEKTANTWERTANLYREQANLR